MGVSIFYKKGNTRVGNTRGKNTVDTLSMILQETKVPPMPPVKPPKCEPEAIKGAAEAMAKLGKALSGINSKKEINTVTVRWHDGYKEVFRATEVRFGSDLLWMRLEDGSNRHIPLRSVRWFGTSIESHQSTGF